MQRVRSLVRVAAVLTTLWLTAGAEWPIDEVLRKVARC
jgi:hypothetical protein